MRVTVSRAAEALQAHSHPIIQDDPLDLLIERIGDARYVLLGEASHGTHEYYTWRARITKRLISEQGFRFVAVEGDWPDCYEINRYVKGWIDGGTSARAVVNRFERWPTWMWANWEVVAFAEWLQDFNRGKSEEEKAGFYGLDVYSLWESLDSVIRHMRLAHPESVQRAIDAASCFEPYNRSGQSYAFATQMASDSCADEVVEILTKLKQEGIKYPDDPEAHFNAEQNAHVAVNAERYYRSMVRSDESSWNQRDTHMADTLDRLMSHYGRGAKAVVWEHNTHIGDARATDMASAGMTNIGQIARERHEDEGVVLVGFGSYEGSVIAGKKWGAPMERMPVPKATDGSWESVMNEVSASDQLYFTREFDAELKGPRGHRAIGVVYNPEFEHFGNYVPTYLDHRYDAFLFLNRTQALHPLHLEPATGVRTPETYPWGV